MEKITIAVEEWMYSNPLNFRFYLNIPDSIAVTFSNFTVKITNTKQKKNAAMTSFLDVLESLAGSNIRNYFGEL